MTWLREQLKFIFSVEQHTLKVCAGDTLFNTRNKSGISKHSCSNQFVHKHSRQNFQIEGARQILKLISSHELSFYIELIKICII